MNVKVIFRISFLRDVVEMRWWWRWLSKPDQIVLLLEDTDADDSSILEG